MTAVSTEYTMVVETVELMVVSTAELLHEREKKHWQSEKISINFITDYYNN